MLYECGLNGGSYLSHDVSCAGNPALGPVGYAYRAAAGNRRPIYSCQSSGGSLSVAKVSAMAPVHQLSFWVIQ